MGSYIYDIQEKCPIFAPLSLFFCLAEWVRIGQDLSYPWTSKFRIPTTPAFNTICFGVLAKIWNARKKTKTLSKALFPSEPDTCLSGTLIAEPYNCLEHCLDTNNTYTNYSCGYPISSPSPPYSCNHPLPSEFLPFFTGPPSPHLLDVINVWSLCNIIFPIIDQHRYFYTSMMISFWSSNIPWFWAKRTLIWSEVQRKENGSLGN